MPFGTIQWSVKCDWIVRSDGQMNRMSGQEETVGESNLFPVMWKDVKSQNHAMLFKSDLFRYLFNTHPHTVFFPGVHSHELFGFQLHSGTVINTNVLSHKRRRGEEGPEFNPQISHGRLQCYHGFPQGPFLSQSKSMPYSMTGDSKLTCAGHVTCTQELVPTSCPKALIPATSKGIKWFGKWMKECLDYLML